jgi:hypothetical protein
MTLKKLMAAAALAAAALLLGALVGQTGSGRAAGTTTGTTTTAKSTGCPSGSGPIQVADLAPPARLMIERRGITPAVVSRSTTSIDLHFLVTACNGRPVQGADLFAISIPYNQFTGEHATTGADGTVNITESRQAGFPASRRQELLVVLARATKPGEPLIGGVSSRRAVSFPVSLG